MKIYKIIILCCLFNMTNLCAKIYPSGVRVTNVLDICILLDDIEIDGQSLEERRVARGELNNVPITEDLSNIIKSQEAAIVSSSLIRAFIEATKTRSNEFKKIKGKYRKSLNALLDENIWEIYTTYDNEFAILLPKKKYADISTPIDTSQKRILLEHIGLNEAILDKCPNDIIRLNRRLTKQEFSKHKININTLINIFKIDEIQVNKRIYLTGHGSENFCEEKIANLQTHAFQRLRDCLDQTDCSFLYIVTCFGSGNIYRAQSAIENPTEATTNYNKKPALSQKKFIEISEGLPGQEVKTSKDFFDKFFLNVHNFLADEMLAFKREKIEERITEITEQQMLSGKNITRIAQYCEPLIERHPEIHTFKSFRKIFSEGFRINKLENIPYCRFPGGYNFTPIKNIIPHIKDKHISPQKIKFLQPQDNIYINQNISDIIVNATAIINPIIINIEYLMPRLHFALQGQSHHYIKKLIIKCNGGVIPNITQLILRSIYPQTSRHNKAIFIGELILKDAAGHEDNLTAKNIFIIKYAEQEEVNNFLFFLNIIDNRYHIFEITPEQSYDQVEQNGQIIDNTSIIEYDILNMFGSAKPKRYMGEIEEETEGKILSNIETITRFTQRDLEQYKNRTFPHNFFQGHQFVMQYYKKQINQSSIENLSSE